MNGDKTHKKYNTLCVLSPDPFDPLYIKLEEYTFREQKTQREYFQ